MNRLQSELQRLYLSTPGGGDTPALIGADGRVRALVLELARPASWEVLSVVWREVQRDLEWPAPAIAVSGTDGLQLWFSLAEAVPAQEAQQMLATLCTRYLSGVAASQLRLWPMTVASQRLQHAPLVPAEQAHTGNWSAFVAPDLAPVFADTPWLDIPPNPEGQADLLGRLGSITPAAWSAAQARWSAIPERESAWQRVQTVAPTVPASPSAAPDPKRFLMQVMADDTVALALRIEAAKALLPYVVHPPEA